MSNPSLGQRVADRFTASLGSWRFLLGQSALLLLWTAVNGLLGPSAWDPYPFILLNLFLSLQAAYTGPLVMMSQQRLTEQDRENLQWIILQMEKQERLLEELKGKIDP
jgi:uncharacterized membrane protein